MHSCKVGVYVFAFRTERVKAWSASKRYCSCGGHALSEGVLRSSLQTRLQFSSVGHLSCFVMLRSSPKHKSSLVLWCGGIKETSGSLLRRRVAARTIEWRVAHMRSSGDAVGGGAPVTEVKALYTVLYKLSLEK